MSRSSSKSNWAPLLVIGALVALVSVYSLSGRDKIEGDDNDAEELHPKRPKLDGSKDQ